MDKFQMDEKTLEMYLFNYDTPQKGPQTYLCTNYLPHFMSYLLQRLTRKERCSVIEIDVQTYILELALYNLKYKSLRDLANGLMREIRLTPKFWITNSEAQNDVHLRIKIFNHILNGIKPETEQEIEHLRKCVSQLDFDNLDFKNETLKYEGIDKMIKDRIMMEDSASKQMAAINNYVKWHNGIQEKIKDSLVKQVESSSKQGEERNGQNNLNMPSNVFDWMSRYNVFDFFAQRETRQQTKNISGGETISHREVKLLIREQQRIEMQNKRTLWVPNKIYKYQKIDIIILPYVFQQKNIQINNWDRFLIKQQKEYSRNHLRLQNFILYLVYTDQEQQKSSRLKKNILLSEGEGDHKTSSKQFNYFLKCSKDKIMNDFNEYCLQKNICLSYYFSSVPAQYKKELILVRNILLLGYTFAQTILPEELQYSLVQEDENEMLVKSFEEITPKQSVDQSEETPGKKNIQSYQKWKKNQNDYFYLQVLHQLELYFAIPPDQFKQLIDAYIQNIEIIFTSKRDHMIQYQSILRQFNRNQMMGTLSSKEEIDQAIEAYLKYFDSPLTQEKRSYMFHSSQRQDWNEEQYKLFLTGLEKYFEIVVNNRKISKFMGEDVSVYHVRYVKGHYLRQLKKRAKEENKNRKELLRQDIDNFDISIFDFVNRKKQRIEEKSLSENKNEDTTLDDKEGIKDNSDKQEET